MVNPYFSLWESKPQGELMEVRAWEDGKSECRPVTGRIGAESVEGKIAPRESAPTSIRSFTTREPDKPTKEKKQMTATQAGAFSLDVKMDSTLKGRRQLLTLYKEQGGICPICHQEFTEISEWHRHHLIRRTNGGKNIVGNLVLLHPECHRQVHSQSLTVVKPRP